MNDMTRESIKCDNCCYLIPLSDIELETEIVSKDVVFSKGIVQTENGEAIKKKFVAVCYSFVCPMCFHRYNCFYKDKTVNDLFNSGKQKEANERMMALWEFFENE